MPSFWDGKDLSLFAYDMDGRLKWRQNLGGFRSQHGAGHSPIVYDGKVILANDQDGSAVLLAFDAKTGKPAWKVERRAFRACYSTPIILERPNERPRADRRQYGRGSQAMTRQTATSYLELHLDIRQNAAAHGRFAGRRGRPCHRQQRRRLRRAQP